MPQCRVSDYVAEVSKVSAIPAVDVRRLLAYAKACDVSEVAGTVWLDEAAYKVFQGALQRFLGGEPLAYILGEWSFWSLDVVVGPGVLIPRADTECLVAAVLASYGDQPQRVVDLGTGCGAVALALALERQQWQLTAVERSLEARVYAEQNIARYSAQLEHRVTLMTMDWQDFSPEKPSDIWVSNPPYIDAEDTDLDSLVRANEPAEALLASDEGMAAFASLLQAAERGLKPGGAIFFEHGWRQAQRLRQLLLDFSYRDIRSYKDSGGRDRVVAAIKA